MDYLLYMIRTIDLVNIKREYFITATDHNGANFYLYHDGKKEYFSDYGLELSLTMQAIYKYFRDLEDELRNENVVPLK